MSSEVTEILVNGEFVDRIKYGAPEEGNWGADEGYLCHDCGAREGEFHDLGCDVERCPGCSRQLISCGCQIGFDPKKVEEHSFERKTMDYSEIRDQLRRLARDIKKDTSDFNAKAPTILNECARHLTKFGHRMKVIIGQRDRAQERATMAQSEVKRLNRKLKHKTEECEKRHRAYKECLSIFGDEKGDLK